MKEKTRSPSSLGVKDVSFRAAPVEDQKTDPMAKPCEKPVSPFMCHGMACQAEVRRASVKGTAMLLLPHEPRCRQCHLRLTRKIGERRGREGGGDAEQ